MAEVLPNGRRDTIEFFRVRLPAWAKDPAAVGLTGAQVGALSAMVSAADAARAAADTARDAARAATGTFHAEADAMRRFGADLIKTVKAFAATTGDPAVYAAARIPPPGAGAPTPPPPAPTRLAAALDAFGHASLRWRAPRAGGVQFVVQRRLTPIEGEPGPWSFAGLAAGNAYTDTELPRGYGSVAYTVMAVTRAGRSPPSNAAVLAFGVAPAAAAGAGHAAA